MCDIGGELPIIFWFTGVETVFVLEPDNHLIYQWHAQTRNLGIGTTFNGCAPACGAGSRVDDTCLPDARCSPGTDYGLAVGVHGGAGQAIGRHLKGKGGDVLVSQITGAFTIPGAKRVGVNQVEDFTQVHRKRLLALPDKYPTVGSAAGNGDVKHVLAGVAGVITKGLCTDVIQGFVKDFGTGVHVGGCLHGTGATIPGNDIHCVGLSQLNVGPVTCIANVFEGHRYHPLVAIRPDRQLNVVQVVFQLETERQVLNGIAVVVDVNFIDGVVIQIKIIGTAIGILQWQVIGNQGYEVASATFVAPEHIKVSAVDLGDFGDEGRFTVTRSLGQAGGEAGSGHGDSEAGPLQNCFHVVFLSVFGCVGGRNGWWTSKVAAVAKKLSW